MKRKIRSLTVLLALVMCFGAFSVTAYAQSNEPQPEQEETEKPEETASPNPFTPDGTGTVLDNAREMKKFASRLNHAVSEP